MLFEGEVKAVIELASFERFSDTHQQFLDQLMESIGIVLNTIQANTRTEDLLTQSQSLATELQSRQRELQQSNAELEEKATLLAEQNAEVERKNTEVEQARQALEEKATQLALTSKYKSEFLANMSHELRTPLNSLLILAEQLAMNARPAPVRARRWSTPAPSMSSGNDLLKLINDILDLAKIESGTVSVDVGAVAFRDLEDYVERTFRPVAESKKLELLGRARSAPAPEHADRLQAAAADPAQPAVERLQVHRARQGLAAHRTRRTRAGAPTISSLNRAPVGHRVLRRATPASASSPRSRASSSRPSSRRTAARAAATAGPASGSRSAASSRACSAARSASPARPGRGSTFNLYLPQAYSSRASPRARRRSAATASSRRRTAEARARAAGDRARGGRTTATSILPGDRVLLVVEDDPAFAQIVREAAHAHGFKSFIESRGAGAVTLARELRPDAITLDLHLPDIDGRRVLTPLEGRPRHAPHPRAGHLGRAGAA